MLTFLLKRLAQAVVVMLVISLVAFAIQSNLGDPLREMVGQGVSEAQREILRTQLGLNDPLPCLVLVILPPNNFCLSCKYSN